MTKTCVTPNALEEYVAFTINKNLVFIDSMEFMISSLDALVKNLLGNDFKYLFQECIGDLLELVNQKGVYPYEYVDSYEKFFENKLPDRCELFKSLKDEFSSEKDYLDAINVWNTFKMNRISDFHDLYLKPDVLLFLVVFEKFSNTYLEYYWVDPSHYFISHDLSWDTFLIMTGIELELISDTDMHLFIEKEIGGVSYIAKKHSKANNK